MRVLTTKVIISRVLNRLTCGPEGWTLCARIWQARLEGSDAATLLARAIDHVFALMTGEFHHCHRNWLRQIENR